MLKYNLRTLLALTAFVAVVTWTVVVLPSKVGLITLLALMAVLPGIVVAGIFYLRGYPRAFCIAAAPAHVIPLMILFPYLLAGAWAYIYDVFALGYYARYGGYGGYAGHAPYGPDPPSADDLMPMKICILAFFAIIGAAGLSGMLIRFLSLPVEYRARAESIHSRSHTVTTDDK